MSTMGAYPTGEGGAFKEGFLYGAMHELVRRIRKEKKKKAKRGVCREKRSFW